MAQSYAEYLKSLGATDDDLKVLDHPVARKAWESQQAAVTAAAQKATAAEGKVAEYKKWYDDEAQPAFAAAVNERDVAKANYEAEKARNKALQEAGLIAVAEDAKPGSTKPGTGETPAFDDRYVDRATLLQVAEREGEAIAIFADIQAEHQRLFGTPLSARELRKEALSQKKSVEEVWMQKYGVEAKRAEVLATAQKSREDKLVADAVKAKEVELASKYGNPLVAPPVPSRFADRPPSTLPATEQPWNRNESLAANERVAKVMKGLVQ